MRRRLASPDLALTAVTAIWGSTFLIVQRALPYFSPLVFLLLRFVLASAVVLLLYRKKLKRAGFVPGVVTGLFLFSGYAFQTIGLQFTTSSKSAFLTSLSVPMVPLVASFVYRRGPGLWELLGVLAATAGMLLLTAPEHMGAVNKGDLLSFCCAVLFAGQVVAVSHFAGRGNFESLVTAQLGTVAVLSAGTCWWVEAPVFRPAASAWTAVGITGLLATALAFSVQGWAQESVPVTRAAIIYALEPVFAVAVSYFVAGEVLTVRGMGGAALILLGILIVELKRRPVLEHQEGVPALRS